jgi:gliding motility-associated-like protein
MKKILFFLGVFVSLLFGFNNQAKASHYMGGEITWECLTSGINAGKYIFTMKVYRECNGINFGTSQTLASTSPAGSIPLTIVTGWPKDISPNCNGIGPAITCAGATLNNTGAVEEFVYRSQPVQISGIPPATGWKFYWYSCCRNPSTNVPNATSKGWQLRAKMYPYNGLNAYPCHDDSPVFAEISRSVITAGYPFTYNHNAYDKQLDSLSFEWGQPLGGSSSPYNTPLAFGPGYAYNSPLPGTAQNVNNVPATVNVYTGEISFTSYTTGAFVTSTKVSAYRCGQLVAEIWRDMQVVLLTGVTNNPPLVTPPFGAGTTFSDTVLAGDSVCFNLSATDFEFLPNGSPQTMNITASGLQFGAFIPGSGGSQPTMSPTFGCLNPPCAVLTPAPGPGSPLTGVFGVQTDFCWHTDCDHLATDVGCGTMSNVYTFVLKVEDDYCPAPASNISTITIVVGQKPTVDMPEIQCLKVQPNGDVDFSWSMPDDTTDSFLSYRLYSSTTPAGPYVEIDSIFDINQLTYHHTGANAGSAPIYYSMRLVSGCDFYSDSVIATPIFLSVNNPNNGTALLNWNATHTPLLSTSSSYYHIYREYPTGTWLLIDSTTNTSYTDTISACGDTVNYRIEIIDTGMVDTAGVHYSCNSISNVSGDYFSDVIAPDIPVIDSVSVDPITGFTSIAWEPSTAGDIGGYIIYIELNGVWTPIDTLWTKNTVTNYIDQINSACGSAAGFNSYKIAAFDTCFTASHPQNLSPLSLAHNTIGLAVVKDVCDDLMTLTWNAYNNMTSGIAAYDIFVSENGGAVSLLNSSPATATSFVHVGLNNGSTYTYLIHARDVSGTRFSTSCVKSEMAVTPKPPQFVYIRTASVLSSNNGVYVKIHTDTSGKVSEYLLERYDPSSAVWNQVGTIPPDYTNPTISYTDMTAMVRQQWYQYRAIVVDSCGKEIDTSQVVKTMLLEVVANDNLSNDLTWNAYEGFSGTPTVFEIYRGVDGVWDPMPIATLPENLTSYVDDVQGLSNSGGTFDYYVSAVEGGGNVYGLPGDSSRSNTVQALQKPKLYVPSAFSPESTDTRNRTFYPVGVFVNAQDYTFIVFNRWGEKLFETTEINTGWDGTYNGVDSPQGVYTYFVKFTTADGREFEKRGTVTLLR